MTLTLTFDPRRFFKFLLVGNFFLASIAVAQPLGLPPVSPKQIVNAVKDCAAIKASDGVSPSSFTKNGWDRGTVASYKALPVPIGFYSKANMVATVAVPKESTKPVCTINAQLSSRAALQQLKERLAKEFTVVASNDSDIVSTFQTQDNRSIELTGNQHEAAPVARLRVTFPTQESK